MTIYELTVNRAYVSPWYSDVAIAGPAAIGLRTYMFNGAQFYQIGTSFIYLTISIANIIALSETKLLFYNGTTDNELQGLEGFKLII